VKPFEAKNAGLSFSSLQMSPPFFLPPTPFHVSPLAKTFEGSTEEEKRQRRRGIEEKVGEPLFIPSPLSEHVFFLLSP